MLQTNRLLGFLALTVALGVRGSDDAMYLPDGFPLKAFGRLLVRVDFNRIN